MFRTNGIVERSDISLDNIGHSFETSGWNFFLQTLILCVKSYLEVQKKDNQIFVDEKFQYLGRCI